MKFIIPQAEVGEGGKGLVFQVLPVGLEEDAETCREIIGWM